MKAKTFSRLLLTILFGISFSWNVSAQFSGGGSGTAADPFKIKTVDDLNNVRNYIGSSHAGKHFRLMNDLDLTTFLQNSAEGWMPIGENNNPFTSYFHGGGHRVDGLWINRPSVAYVGFFGINSGTIDSLIVAVAGKNINGGNRTGGFVGDNSGTITQCSVEGSSSVTISSTQYGGGFAGNNSRTLSYCYATVSSSSSSHSGGLTGCNTGTITNCYATGNSSAFYSSYSPSYSGGLTGDNEGTITNCYATGNSSLFSSFYESHSGGFVGYQGGGSIFNCYSVGQVTSNDNHNSNIGAFAGSCSNANNLSQCYYNSDITGSMSSVGNGVGNNNVLGVTTNGMKLQTTFTNWDFDAVWTIEESITYPYFQKMEGLELVCSNSTHDYSTYAGKSNYVWTVSNGSIVSGQSTNRITVKWNNNANLGKITVTYNNTGKTIKNITLVPLPTTPIISGENNPFILTEYTYSTEPGKSNYIWTISDGVIVSGLGTSTVTVQWTGKTGKLSVNYANEGDCMAETPAEISVTVQSYFGGGTGTITDPFQIANGEHLSNIYLFPYLYYCLVNDIDLSDYLKNSSIGWTPIPYFYGSFDGRFFKIKGLWINQPNDDDLGLFANNIGTIENVYIEIDSKGIYGNNYIGGLVANNYGTILQCSVKESNLTSKGTDVGSLVGFNLGIISLCYSTNTVVWGAERVGGLLGSTWGVDAKIQQCYAINTVVGSQYVGGLIGDMYNDATCSQSYSASIVEGGNYTGGFLGYNNNGIITGCYYDAYNSGQKSGLGNDDSQTNNIRAKQPAEMLSHSTFLGWDFNNVWINTDGETYPYFRWQNIAPTPPPNGIAQIQSDPNLFVYPNPTNGMVYIKCVTQSPVSIYNLLGKLVYQLIPEQEETAIDMSAYPTGIYILRTENQIIKVIKK